MTRRRPSLDPALLPEARMDKMREDMWRLRRAVISLIPEAYRDAVNPPHDLPRDESMRWREVAAQRVIKLTVPDEMGKARQHALSAEQFLSSLESGTAIPLVSNDISSAHMARRFAMSFMRQWAFKGFDTVRNGQMTTVLMAATRYRLMPNLSFQRTAFGGR